LERVSFSWGLNGADADDVERLPGAVLRTTRSHQNINSEPINHIPHEVGRLCAPVSIRVILEGLAVFVGMIRLNALVKSPCTSRKTDASLLQVKPFILAVAR